MQPTCASKKLRTADWSQCLVRMWLFQSWKEYRIAHRNFKMAERGYLGIIPLDNNISQF